jgi:hypothetical protein
MKRRRSGPNLFSPAVFYPSSISVMPKEEHQRTAPANPLDPKMRRIIKTILKIVFDQFILRKKEV